MFIIDANLTDLKIREKTLYKVLFSLNIHEVATPELSAEDAKSYVFIIRDGGKYVAYIGLYFPNTDRTLYYGYSDNPFTESSLSDVENEARNFTEDMGAMLDELDISKLSAAEQQQWINDQDIFSSIKKREEQQPAAVPVESTPPVEQDVNGSVQKEPVITSDETVATNGQAPVEQDQPAPMVTSVWPDDASKEPSREPDSPVTEQPRVPERATPAAPPPRPQKELGSVAAVNEVRNQAGKSGLKNSSKEPVAKNSRGSSGVASREKEALARLLASF
jgi:hypothetical protein